jgi:hypothetical protein
MIGKEYGGRVCCHHRMFQYSQVYIESPVYRLCIISANLPAAMIAVFLSLGLALSGLFIKDIAYAFAALPFVIVVLAVLRK